MRHTRLRALAFAAALIFSSIQFLTIAADARQAPPRRDAAATAREASATMPDISYTVSMSRPSTHLLEVEMRVRWNNSPPSPVDLLMPVWTPGSYLIREFERHVQDFATRDAGSGRALQWNKVNKNTWRVEPGTARELVANYKVYANELTVRTNELNDGHAFWNNAALLMYPEGQLAAPSTVSVVAPANWKIATGLPAAPGNERRHVYRAENYDVLYDSPFLASDFKTIEFEVRGIPHRIVVDGAGNFDAERLRRDVRKIVETATGMMREIAYSNYTFMLMLAPTGSGGLEHLNSTALIYKRFGFRPEADYQSFLTLAAHEYFHNYNVKRLRPDALGPFDYTRENYTRLLWVAEGITSYYENVLVRRAGLTSDKDYLDKLAKDIQALQNTPGRLEMSAEESSFDAWIKYYRPDENSVNSSVSYYDKGAIVGALLDLEIRKRSGGARSLDDVMRYLFTEYFKKNRNYTPADFQRAAELAAGASLEDFFSRSVRGRGELDYDAALEAVGLRLDTASNASGKTALEKAFLGATFAKEGEQVLGRATPAGALVVKTVPSDTPASEQGLNAGDQLVAVDGTRAATLDFLNARLEEKRPGDAVTLTVFRADALRTFQIKLAARADTTYRILPAKQPGARQMQSYQDWLGAPYPKAN